MNKIINYVIPVITGILGFGLGYKFAVKKVTNDIKTNVDEIESECDSLKKETEELKEQLENNTEESQEKEDESSSLSVKLTPDKITNEEIHMNSDSSIPKSPYDISEETYLADWNHNYTTIELFYYTDGVLADNANNIHNIQDIAGNLDIPELFNKYDDNVIYIRDDYNELDYRIYQCDREFESLEI